MVRLILSMIDHDQLFFIPIDILLLKIAYYIIHTFKIV